MIAWSIHPWSLVAKQAEHSAQIVVCPPCFFGCLLRCFKNGFKLQKWWGMFAKYPRSWEIFILVPQIDHLCPPLAAGGTILVHLGQLVLPPSFGLSYEIIDLVCHTKASSAVQVIFHTVVPNNHYVVESMVNRCCPPSGWPALHGIL